MTAAEAGLLLLCCQLGDRAARPLTIPQLRDLTKIVRAADQRQREDRPLLPEDVRALGYPQAQAERIVELLCRRPLLNLYLEAAAHRGIGVLTKNSIGYPGQLERAMGLSCPPALFYLGNPALLERPAISVVGSRKLAPENGAMADQIGRLAAKENLVLVSGGALGADQRAQEACLAAGGSCIVVLPDALCEKKPRERVLYLSEEGWEVPFSAPRALHRNHLIHALGQKTLAVQTSLGTGGTWQGCMENLRHGWSDLYVYDDGSEGARALQEQGALAFETLDSLQALCGKQTAFF